MRASYSLKASPKYKDRRDAIASVFSQMRSVGVPLGMSDPDKPNISSTLWRSVIDQETKRYYFDSVINPSVIWVDLQGRSQRGREADDAQARRSVECGRRSVRAVQARGAVQVPRAPDETEA